MNPALLCLFICFSFLSELHEVHKEDHKERLVCDSFMTALLDYRVVL